jgi:methyl-accepting chemotaxis protein
MPWLSALWRRVGIHSIRALRRWQVWLASMLAARQELAELNQITEHDFLQVGEKLQRFLEESGRISDRCANLVGVLSGADTERGAGDLRSILDRARSMAAQAEGNHRALEQMLEGVRHVVQPLSDLNSKMRSFRVMATLIRIEGSRLNQSGVDFEILAEDVRKLASDIEENGRKILDGSLDLRDTVARAESAIAEFEARQKMELPRIKKQAELGLLALRQRGNHASSTAREMATHYESVRRDIGGLVMSLQFHDITRQQVEHAAAALEQANQITAGDAATLVQVCRLQKAQLTHARQAFLAALTHVKDSLMRISRNVLQMAEQTTSLLAGAGGRAGTFLGEMEQEFGGIRAALAECAESRHSLRMIAGTVAEGVREMSVFVAAIEEIGLRMQRIALNANIKAISIGAEGTALGAVADAIQRLAAESTNQTGVVTAGIGEIARGSERLTAGMSEASEDLTSELERVIAVFHEADRDNGLGLAQIGESGRSFSAELDALCVSIQADRLLSAAIERSCQRLEEIAQAAGSMASRKQEAEPPGLIRNLETQYTMHAERAVHQQAAGDTAPADPSPRPEFDEPAEAVAAGQWGENVELF